MKVVLFQLLVQPFYQLLCEDFEASNGDVDEFAEWRSPCIYWSTSHREMKTQSPSPPSIHTAACASRLYANRSTVTRASQTPGQFKSTSDTIKTYNLCAFHSVLGFRANTDFGGVIKNISANTAAEPCLGLMNVNIGAQLPTLCKEQLIHWKRASTQHASILLFVLNSEMGRNNGFVFIAKAIFQSCSKAIVW